jgi:glycosyltransferase involved in cell wall biosynthesis
MGFIFPSLYEGFGLPILEAMNCGCPVLCSNAASIPEVSGLAALYFDPLKVDDIASTIKTFISDPELEIEYKNRGFEQAAGFKWEKTAKNTLDALITFL